MSDFEAYIAEDGMPAIRMTDAGQLKSANLLIDHLRRELKGYKEEQDRLTSKLADISWWVMMNETREPPLDWKGLGELLNGS